MSTELMTLRMLAVCANAGDFELLRSGAALATLPLELFEAESAQKAPAMLARREPDLVLVDGKLAEHDRAQIAKAARELEKPAFVIELCDDPDDHKANTSCADAMAPKPRDAKAAQIVADGCVRSRLRSRVLVVDDSATMRSIVKKILGASRFPLQLTEAAEGQAALNIIGRHAADIVFMDYNMPGLNGVETLEALRVSNRKVRVVIMTSADDESVAARALAAGADAFLKKPFYPADVDAVMYGLFGLTPVLPAKS